MLAIFGWIVCLLLLLKVSVAVILMSMNNLGTFNIGGSVNSTKTKIFTVISILVVGYWWYLIGINAPFTFSLS